MGSLLFITLSKGYLGSGLTRALQNKKAFRLEGAPIPLFTLPSRSVTIQAVFQTYHECRTD